MNFVLAPSLPLKLAYRHGLRQYVEQVQRRRYEHKAPRAPVPEFASIEEGWEYLDSRWSWGSDKERANFWADWSSEPEVLQYRLEREVPNVQLDIPGLPRHTQLKYKGLGDCDDYAAWMCRIAEPHAEFVVRLSLWTYGKGHTVCVYMEKGQLVVVDYELVKIDSFDDIIRLLQKRYQYGSMGWVWETPELELISISPDHPPIRAIK